MTDVWTETTDELSHEDLGKALRASEADNARLKAELAKTQASQPVTEMSAR